MSSMVSPSQKCAVLVKGYLKYRRLKTSMKPGVRAVIASKLPVRLSSDSIFEMSRKSQRPSKSGEKRSMKRAPPSQKAGMTFVRPPFGERNSARSVTLA